MRRWLRHGVSIPLASVDGASVLDSDTSVAMVSEAQRPTQLAQAAGSPDFCMPRFEVRDLESSSTTRGRRRRR